MRKSCRIIVGLLLFLLTQAGTAYSQPLPARAKLKYRYPDPLQQEFDKRDPDKRSVLTDFFLKQNVVFDRPEFWTRVASPGLAMAAVQKFGEPLSNDALNCLERLLPKAEKSVLHVLFAATLYRYLRPAGRDSLLRLVDSKYDEEAAAILAMNRDGEARESILRILKRRPDLESRDLAEALGAWRSPRIADELLKASVKAPENLNLIVALSNQGGPKSLNRIKSVYGLLADSSPGKADAAAAMVNVHSSGSDLLLAKLISATKTKRGPDFLRSVYVLCTVNHPRAYSRLVEIIAEISKQPFYSEQTVTKPQAGYSMVAATIAAERLAQQKVHAAVPAIAAFIEKTVEIPALVPYRNQCIQALIKLDRPATESLLKKWFDSNSLTDMITVSRLKPILQYMIPINRP